MAMGKKKRSIKVRMGTLVEVDNKDRKFGSSLIYWAGKVQEPDGTESLVLFTPNQIQTAKKTAQKNPEDVLDELWLLDIVT